MEVCIDFRPIDEVIREIQSLPGKKIHLIDDNVGGHVKRARELFTRMIPLEVRWSGLTTLKSIEDEEYVRLAKESGCFHLNLGIESVNPASLADVRKHHNHVGEYRELLERLDRYKIPYSLNFILGLDEDTLETVDLTIDFCRRLKPPLAFFSMLTPRPGTELMDEFVRAGRITNFNYDQYDWDEPVYRPMNMTSEELKKSVWKCYDDFYSLNQIFKRFFKPLRSHLYGELFMNFICWRAVKKRFDPVYYY